MFEPDIKTVGRDWARVLAASLLSSAASRGLRAAKPKAVSESPLPLPLTNGCTSPPATFNPHHPIKQFMLSHHPVPHLPHKGFWPQYLYHRAEGKDVDKKFCFICQVLVNGAEPAFAVLVIFRVLFIVGKVEHAPLQGVALAADFKKDWFRGFLHRLKTE